MNAVINLNADGGVEFVPHTLTQPLANGAVTIIAAVVLIFLIRYAFDVTFRYLRFGTAPADEIEEWTQQQYDDYHDGVKAGHRGSERDRRRKSKAYREGYKHGRSGDDDLPF